ncbi:coiled-coil domain-containing protein 138 [Tachyglossus aculeatus]|uniref:coiled-coil domain-containing protein 138 n=1 Tax=Tachyglossus aculeatus TaxID=9261 RepID=UPI0018F546E6|nr:coiled-coil domain-containing protein 138 [Tachyglossus aculeatus]
MMGGLEWGQSWEPDQALGSGAAKSACSKAVQTSFKSRRWLTCPDSFDSSDDPVSSLAVNSPSKCSPSARKHYRKSHYGLYTHLNRLQGGLDAFSEISPLVTEEESIEDDQRVSLIQNIVTRAETDVTLPSSLAGNPVTRGEYYGDTGESPPKHACQPAPKIATKTSLLPSYINQIYDELLLIHQKLQHETAAQQEYALQLQKKEEFLMEKEETLLQHEAALTEIQGVEEEIHAKFQILKEEHSAEVKHLSEALKEKIKENKRLKSSFDTLKEMNDSLKKQLNEASEENKKMEVQAKRVQARLENLQRKYEFLTVQKSKDVPQAVPAMKAVKQEKAPTSRTCKVPFNTQLYELLAALMDWISEHQLSQLRQEERKGDGQKPLCVLSSHKNYIHEKCAKLLPVIAEQLQWMPFVNPKLHEPVVKFIYWAVRQLDSGTQHTTLTSTLRRLGEDLFRGVVTRGAPSPTEPSPEGKPRAAAFFKSSSFPLRFLSTLVILKTVTQADYLAQAFDSLCLDLKTDEGKALFLECQAVPLILNHLRISSKGLLSNVIDSLLQMTVESRSLQPFLEACSNELFFRTCSVLLRNPRLDMQILEKLSILLQKLSKIKSNKKLFELFTIHLLLQEIQRTAHPDNAFLSINLNSTLFNLGLTKCGSMATTAVR